MKMSGIEMSDTGPTAARYGYRWGSQPKIQEQTNSTQVC